MLTPLTKVLPSSRKSGDTDIYILACGKASHKSTDSKNDFTTVTGQSSIYHWKEDGTLSYTTALYSRYVLSAWSTPLI